jgi:hypothetical protein
VAGLASCMQQGTDGKLGHPAQHGCTGPVRPMRKVRPQAGPLPPCAVGPCVGFPAFSATVACSTSRLNFSL